MLILEKASSGTTFRTGQDYGRELGDIFYENGDTAPMLGL
jgi:hypothetical protein